MEPIEKQYLGMLKNYKSKAKRWNIFVPKSMKRFGLCHFTLTTQKPEEMQHLLRYRFKKCGLDSQFPFDMVEYDRRSNNLTQHLCPVRNAWIDEEIARFEKL